MLTFIADFAAVDETTRTFNALVDASPVSADDAKGVFEAYEESARAMLDNRGDLDGRVPVRLLAAFDARIDEVICRQIGIGAMALVSEADPTFDGACRLSNLRFRAAQEAVALRSCTGPVPTSMQDCP